MSTDVVTVKVVQWIPIPGQTKIGSMSIALMAICVWDWPGASERERQTMSGRHPVAAVDSSQLHIANGAIDPATTFKCDVNVFQRRAGAVHVGR